MARTARGGECLCAAGFLLQFLILLKCSAITATITTPVKEYNNMSATDELMTLRNIGRSLTLCLTTSKRWTCLEQQLNRALVAVAEDDSTWKYGDFITVEKLPRNRSDVHEEQSSISSKERAQRQRALPVDASEPVQNSIAESLLEIAKSRSIRLQLPSSVQALNKIGVGISDAIDLLAPTEPLTSTEAAQADAGTPRILNGLVDDKVEQFLTKLTVSGYGDDTIHLQNDKNTIELDKDKRKKLKKKKDKCNKKKVTMKKDKYKDKDEDKNKKTKKKKKIGNNKYKDKYKDKYKKKHKDKYKKRKKNSEEGHLHNENSLKGRKKKGKDKNMAMMGGMALIAMVAQMFLGKVILIAGAAFVMAKIALLVSLLGSLKKESIGSSGSTKRIVVTSPGHGGGDGGGHGHGHSAYGYDSGWHRSMPLTYPKAEIISEEPEHKKAHYHTSPQAHTPPDSYYYSKIIEAANEDASDDNSRKGAQSGFL